MTANWLVIPTWYSGAKKSHHDLPLLLIYAVDPNDVVYHIKVYQSRDDIFFIF